VESVPITIRNRGSSKKTNDDPDEENYFFPTSSPESYNSYMEQLKNSQKKKKESFQNQSSISGNDSVSLTKVLRNPRSFDEYLN
jgi:hypothetical protein